jgi:hypothetical protein
MLVTALETHTSSACLSDSKDKDPRRFPSFDCLSLEPHKQNLGECVSGVVTSVMHSGVIHLGHRSHKRAAAGHVLSRNAEEHDANKRARSTAGCISLVTALFFALR